MTGMLITSQQRWQRYSSLSAHPDGNGLTQPESGWQYLPAAFHWRHERTAKIAGTLSAKETLRHPAAHRHFADWIDWPDRLSTKSVDNPVDTNCHRASISRSIGTAQKTGSPRCLFLLHPQRGGLLRQYRRRGALGAATRFSRCRKLILPLLRS